MPNPKPTLRDFSIEIYDGWPGYVESDVARWIANTGGVIGFWAGRRSGTAAPHIISGEGRSAFSSSTSVSVASASRSTLATETAFSSPIRTTLVGSTIPASIRSRYSPRRASKPKVPLPLRSRSTTTPGSAPEFAAIWRAGVSSAWRRMRTLVALALRLFLLHGVDRAQQSQTAAGNDAFGDRRLGRGDGIVEGVLSILHLRL
jgi:hypothetical protein